jgi:Trypsin-like peptidase domain
MRPPRRAASIVAGAVLAGGGAALAVGCGGGSAASHQAPPRVVRVTVAVDGLVPQVATGVATGDGRVLTVAHALTGGHAVDVAGRRATVLRADRRLDLALLSVPGLHAPTVRLGGDARHVEIPVLRDRRRTLGGSIRRRVLVRWRDQPGDPPQPRPGIEVAARIDPGDSGAPVVDRRGRVLGVLYARSSDAPATAWAVDGTRAPRPLTRSVRRPRRARRRGVSSRPGACRADAPGTAPYRFRFGNSTPHVKNGLTNW